LPLCAGEKNRYCANRDTSSVLLDLPSCAKEPANSGDFVAEIILLALGTVSAKGQPTVK
jgi:hypothetical protein